MTPEEIRLQALHIARAIGGPHSPNSLVASAAAVEEYILNGKPKENA